MKNNNIKKINDLGKIGKLLCIILIVITAIGIAAVTAMGIAAATLPDDFMKIDGKWNCTTVTDYSSGMIGTPYTDEDYNRDGSFFGLNIHSVSKYTEDSGNSNIIKEVSEKTVNGTMSKSMKVLFFAIAIFILLMLILLDISLHFAKTLCKALEKCETPFSDEIVKKMRNFAISLIPFGIFCVGAGGASAIGIAFIIIIVLLFSAIFKYGAELQRESDETL